MYVFAFLTSDLNFSLEVFDLIKFLLGLNENCSDLLSFTSSDAGMHIIADIESGIDDQIAYEALLGKGIESLPLSVYCLQPIERTALVLGFSGVPRKRMPKLVKKMSETLRSIH